MSGPVSSQRPLCVKTEHLSESHSRSDSVPELEADAGIIADANDNSGSESVTIDKEVIADQPDQSMSRERHLVYSILRFLQDQVSNGALDEERNESVEVAVQCLEQVYGLEMNNEETHRFFSDTPHLLDVFCAAVPEVQSAGDASNLPPQASAAEKEEAEKYKAQGNDLMKAEKYEDALKYYTSAIEVDGRNAVYYCNRAAAYSKLNNHQAAIEDCDKAIQIDPKYSKAFGRKGLAHTALENHKDAWDCYKCALDLDPSNQSYQANLDIAEQKLRETNLAGNPSGAAGMPGFPGFGGMDFSSFLNNPAVMNMATRMMSNPQMQDLMANIIRGQQGASPAEASQQQQGMGNLLEVGQQLAQQMQASNPDLVEQLRDQMNRPPDADEPPSSGNQ